MRRFSIYSVVLLLAAFGLGGYAQTRADERLFEEAKILIFDKKWASARAKLEEILDAYPDSPVKKQALFYRAKCLSEQKGREREAIEAYNAYIDFASGKDRTDSLIEDAEISLIDLAYALYESGQTRFLKTIQEQLDSPNKVVRYYAAFKLSYVRDKAVSGRAVPLLKRIIEDERDAELKDRAKIALLRINPEALRNMEPEARTGARSRILRIQVIEGGKKTVDINLPWALASLALGAIPDSEKSVIKKKGYDLDRIINELANSKSSIVEINDEDSIIRIWIE